MLRREFIYILVVCMNDKDNKNWSKSRDEDDHKTHKVIIEDNRFSREDDDEAEEPESTVEKDKTHAAEAPPSDTDDKRRQFEVVEKNETPPVAPDSHEDDPLLKDVTEAEETFRDMTPEDEERLKKAAQAQFEALSKMGIENYLREIFNIAYILSLQYLGLQPNPSTNLTTTDIKRASVCIDVIDYLRKRLDEFLTTNERTQLSQLISELQIIYSKAFSPKIK